MGYLATLLADRREVFPHMGTATGKCSRCILDKNDDQNIIFDGDGVCHYCLEYEKVEKRAVFKGSGGQDRLNALIGKVKQAGKGKPYDCILGISGGDDST